VYRYCAKYGKDPVKDTYDLETPKHFMNGVVFGLRGCEGEDAPPSFKSVKQVWKDFIAQFRWENDPIPRNTTISVTNVRALMRFLSSYSFNLGNTY
jgi:hypothetical protein